MSGKRLAVPRPLPSVESLRCFFAGAQQLNFRRAAAAVGLTPTAFSERIRALEGELDCQLFTRTTRRVELTQEGQALLPAVERALGGVQACVEAVRGTEELQVRLRVGTRFELGSSWLVPAVIELEQQRSAIEVDLYFGTGQDIVDRLERGLLDAVVTSAPVARENWHAEVLHPETYDFVAAPRLLKRTPFQRIADAHHHTLLDTNDSLPLARYLLSAQPGLEFGRFRACGAAAAVVARVLAGNGVAVLPSYMIQGDLRERKLVRILPKTRLLSDSFRLLFRKATRLTPALQQLAAFLREQPLR